MILKISCTLLFSYRMKAVNMVIYMKRGRMMKMFRIGQSSDIHQLVENRNLILGGVLIPHEKGLQGHSDADALTHAIAESIIGALALGDLGRHFPDTDLQFKNANSLSLLDHVYRLMIERGYCINNLDAMIMIERPKMDPHIEAMRENIANCLHTTIEQINIKATRGEKIGFVGREEGVFAQAIVLLINNTNDK